jgi:hypothetical protein
VALPPLAVLSEPMSDRTGLARRYHVAVANVRYRRLIEVERAYQGLDLVH